MRILEDNPAIRTLEDRGIIKGIQQGIQQEKITIATNMLREGDNISKIAKITGLDITRIIELQSNLFAQHA